MNTAAPSACQHRGDDAVAEFISGAPGLLCGPLAGQGGWPLSVRAVLCDLRPRFLAKSCGGRDYRWVSRNGKILLCADRPLDEVSRCACAVRFQTWHRALLPGDRPQAYGVLFCVRSAPRDAAASVADAGPATIFSTRLVTPPEFAGQLALDVGGGLVLEFRQVAVSL